jgi:acetyl esterase
MLSKKIGLVFVVLSMLISCSETPELIANNNPDNYSVAKDVLWASPDGFDLTMDIYTPTSGEGPYPVIVMFHGGGWMINNKSIMDQAAKYLVSNGRYVVCNVNYRLLVDNDNSVTMNQITEDVFGAVLWVKDRIGQHKGDNTRVIVTGDSAGAQLTAMILNSGDRLSSSSDFASSLMFTPSFLPAGVSAEQVAQQKGLEVQAAILNYGAFDLYESSLQGFESWKNPFWLMGGAMGRGLFGDQYSAQNNPALYKAVSPLYNIPNAQDRKLPPTLVTRGGEDALISAEVVAAYIAKLEQAGQPSQFWEYPGRGHAYLDSGSSVIMGSSFEQDAPEALDVMIAFLDEVFYN